MIFVIYAPTFTTYNCFRCKRYLLQRTQRVISHNKFLGVIDFNYSDVGAIEKLLVYRREKKNIAAFVIKY